MGIRETGHEILESYLFTKETQNSDFSIMHDLYNREVRESLLFIANGIPKLNEEIRNVFP